MKIQNKTRRYRDIINWWTRQTIIEEKDEKSVDGIEDDEHVVKTQADSGTPHTRLHDNKDGIVYPEGLGKHIDIVI